MKNEIWKIMKNEQNAFKKHMKNIADLPKEWICGDTILLANPLAKKNNFKDENAPVYSEGYFFMLAKRHPDNPKLFYAVVVDEGQFATSCLEIDFDGHSFKRAYPFCGLWIHSDDMNFDWRSDRLPKEVVDRVCERLSSLVQGTFIEDGSSDDPFYLKYISEFDKAISAIEDSIQKKLA